MEGVKKSYTGYIADFCWKKSIFLWFQLLNIENYEDKRKIDKNDIDNFSEKRLQLNQ